MIYNFPSSLLEIIDNSLLTMEKNKGIETDKEKVTIIQKEIDTIKDVRLRIMKDTSISRKVKNYLKGIKRDVNLLNRVIEIDGGLQREEWFKSILKVQFIKVFFPQIYNDIRMAGNIFEYATNESSFVIEMIFDISLQSVDYNEKECLIFNHLIYKMDEQDYSRAKTLKKKYHDELYGEEADVGHIEKYIEVAESFEDLEKVLEIYITQDISDPNNIYRKDVIYDGNFQLLFIKLIFDTLSDLSNSFKSSDEPFLSYSKQVMEILLKSGLDESEKRECINRSGNVIRKAIIQNRKYLIDVLFLFFDLKQVQDIVSNSDIKDIDGLYETLRKIVQNNSRFGSLEEGTNKLLSIKKYYEKIITELKRDEYKEIDTEELCYYIDNFFAVCEFWDNIDNTIYNNQEDTNEPKKLLEEFFVLRSDYTFRNFIFDDISTLIKALNALGKFYNAIEDAVDYLILISNILQRLINQCQSNYSWFDGNKVKVEECIEKLIEIARGLVNKKEEYDKEILYKVEIFYFIFKNDNKIATLKSV